MNVGYNFLLIKKMGKNRNKNKHRRGGGKYMHNIEKQTDLLNSLNAEYYDSRSLVKIERNLGYGYFSVIVVNTGAKQKAYCRYMFTRRSPGYSVVEGKDDLQMIAPVSDSCAGQYIIKNKFESIIASAEGKKDDIDTYVSFYTDEEIAHLDHEKSKLQNKESNISIKDAEKEEDESVLYMLQVLVPKLEKKLEKQMKKSSRKSEDKSFDTCLTMIDKLKSSCSRAEAKDYYSNFMTSIQSV